MEKKKLSAMQSEIVIPIFKNEKIVAELDGFRYFAERVYHID